MNELQTHLTEKEILHERAKRLALAPGTAAAAESLELLEFRLAQEHYALETHYVQEVYPLRNLTPLPCTPPFVLGVVNVRGRILPVLDLKKFFGLPESGLTDLHRVIVVGGNGLELGLLADVSVGVLNIPLDSVQPPMPTMTRIGAGYLKGVTADRLIVLEMSRLLSDPALIVNEEVDN